MKILILSFVFILASAKRTPRIGIPLDEIQNELELEPRINILERTKIDQATLQIRAQIEQVNNRLTQDEKDVLISNAEENDPEGYECENQVLEVKEISFVDQVLCYNTTEEICSMVRLNYQHLFDN